MIRDFRPRYILFKINTNESVLPIQRKEMIMTLRLYCNNLYDRSLKEKKIYLTRFNGEKGIVRCKHTEKRSTIMLLRSITQIGTHLVTIDTIATSGTIKTLIQKHDTNKSLTRSKEKKKLNGNRKDCL